MDTNFTNHFCDEVKGKISKCPARLDSHSGQRWAECRASSRVSRSALAWVHASLAHQGISMEYQEQGRSAGGVGLLQERESCISGNKVCHGLRWLHLCRWSSCWWQSWPMWSESVAWDHEHCCIFVQVRRKVCLVLFSKLLPRSVMVYSVRNHLCFRPRHFRTPADRVRGTWQRSPWQFGLPDRRVWPEDLSLSCVSTRRQMLWALGLNLTSTHLD